MGLVKKEERKGRREEGGERRGWDKEDHEGGYALKNWISSYIQETHRVLQNILATGTLPTGKRKNDKGKNPMKGGDPASHV